MKKPANIFEIEIVLSFSASFFFIQVVVTSERMLFVFWNMQILNMFSLNID